MDLNRGVGMTWALSPIPAKKNPQIFPRIHGARTSPGIFSMWNPRLAEAGGVCCARVPLLQQDPSEGWGGRGKAALGSVKAAAAGAQEGKGLTLLPGCTASQTGFWASLRGDAAPPRWSLSPKLYPPTLGHLCCLPAHDWS